MEKEAEEHQKTLAERSARVEAAQDSRVVRLDAWLVQQKGFAFANCTALRQWLAHQPDGRIPREYLDLKYYLGTGNNEIVQDYFMPKLTPSLSEKQRRQSGRSGRVARSRQSFLVQDFNGGACYIIIHMYCAFVLSLSLSLSLSLFLRLQNLNKFYPCTLSLSALPLFSFLLSFRPFHPLFL